MSGFAPLGLAPLAAASLPAVGTAVPALVGVASLDPVALAGVASLAAVGVLGILGGSDDAGDELSGVADLLDVREDPAAIERELETLDEAVDALASNADLDRHLRNPPEPDASCVDKARALSRAVRRDRLSVGPDGTDAGDDDAAASAAARLRREQSPSSPDARQFLDAVAAPERTDADEVEARLADAAGALDAYRALERALDEVPDPADVDAGDASRLRDELAHRDDDVAADVVRLAETAGESRSTVERREHERGRIEDAADSLTDAAADVAALDVGPDSDRSVAERLRALADAVERDDLGFTDADGTGGRAAEVAEQVRRDRRPESSAAKQLLDRLAHPATGDLRPALETAVDRLDAASTTSDIVDDLDREAVRDLADDVAADLEAASGPVADALADRVEELRGLLDRSPDSNVVFPYAVREELEFYDRTLVAHLDAGDGTAGEPGGESAANDAAGGEDAASAGGDADPGVDEVGDRRAEIEDRYVDGRRDHNHSIPLHFLSLVDALLDDAERAAADGDRARASGLAAAADETLDHVEQLYERNEYSVMLRRLRG